MCMCVCVYMCVCVCVLVLPHFASSVAGAGVVAVDANACVVEIIRTRLRGLVTAAAMSEEADMRNSAIITVCKSIQYAYNCLEY